MQDYYNILGIDRQATTEEIKKAYRSLALKYHPDRNAGSRQAEEKFLLIHEAYETLIDPEKRRIYNSQSVTGFYFNTPENIHHYFNVTCSTHRVKVNEEFEVTYTYTGEGRFFVKPSFDHFFVCSKPIVHSRFVIIGGFQVKETQLIYTLAPLQKGDFVINRAKIKIHHKPFETGELIIHVSENECYFLKNKIADGKPYVLELNYEEVVSGQFFKTYRIQRHDVLIPRSKAAQWFHTMGAIVKYAVMAWIMMFCIKTGYGIIAGLLTGGIAGSINCQLFYLLVGVKSKFYFATKHPVVFEYFEQGYYLRNALSSNSTWSKWLYAIESIFK